MTFLHNNNDHANRKKKMANSHISRPGECVCERRTRGRCSLVAIIACQTNGSRAHKSKNTNRKYKSGMICVSVSYVLPSRHFIGLSMKYDKYQFAISLIYWAACTNIRRQLTDHVNQHYKWNEFEKFIKLLFRLLAAGSAQCHRYVRNWTNYDNNNNGGAHYGLR